MTANKYKVNIGGQYYVIPARGSIKLSGEKIKVGDSVESDGFVISALYPRKSYFPRTNVANIDCLVIVVAPVPKPDFLVVDKLIVEAVSCGAEVAIVVNKSDVSTDIFEYFVENYKNAVDAIFSFSATTGEGEDALKDYLKNKLCALAGQSAVGKTSILNRIFGLDNATGEVSQKTMRGRHTTTGREIFFSGEYAVVDTPGFSAVEILNVESRDLAGYYKDFSAALNAYDESHANVCYYIGCSHTSEPDCAIKNAVKDGLISKDRYERYCFIYKEIKEYEKRKY